MSHPTNKPPRVRERCLIAGCDRWEEVKPDGSSTGGLCAGHRYRKKRGLPLEPPLHEGFAHRMSPRQALVAVVLEVFELDTSSRGDPAFARWVDRVCHAAIVYTRASGRRR